jgi:hypothetical protein
MHSIQIGDRVSFQCTWRDSPYQFDGEVMGVEGDRARVRYDLPYQTAFPVISEIQAHVTKFERKND